VSFSHSEVSLRLGELPSLGPVTLLSIGSHALTEFPQIDESSHWTDSHMEGLPLALPTMLPRRDPSGPNAALAAIVLFASSDAGVAALVIVLIVAIAFSTWCRWRYTTAQRIARHANRAQARSAGVLEIADDGIISIDVDQRIIFFNRAAERLFDYRAADVLGRPLDMLVPERYLALHRHHVDEFAQSGKTSRPMSARGDIWSAARWH
jgi:PAS domain-containing protein